MSTTHDLVAALKAELRALAADERMPYTLLVGMRSWLFAPEGDPWNPG